MLVLTRSQARATQLLAQATSSKGSPLYGHQPHHQSFALPLTFLRRLNSDTIFGNHLSTLALEKEKLPVATCRTGCLTCLFLKTIFSQSSLNFHLSVESYLKALRKEK